MKIFYNKNIIDIKKIDYKKNPYKQFDEDEIITNFEFLNLDDISNLLLFTKIKILDNEPVLCLVNQEMIDNGDYNWDEEWESFYELVESNCQIIKYNPFTGEEIEFILKETKDKSADLNRNIENLVLLKERSSQYRKLYNNIYYNFFQKFYEDIE